MENLPLRVMGIVIIMLAVMTPLAILASDIVANLRTDASSTINPTKLPMGDGYSDTPKVGYLYPCLPNIFYSLSTGTTIAGSWIHGSTFDITQKPVVQGEVSWPDAFLNISTKDSNRIIEGNDLPIGQPTGIFPVQESDPAYAYDPNPNAITAQSISVIVPKDPVVSSAPSCVNLPVGIGLDGTLFFSALDSHGHNEPAYEMQDTCGGMSAPNGYYHRYVPSDCMPHTHENNALVGYALDGFGIFSSYDANGKELTTKDLDECHGTTSEIMWDGKKVNMYHYVLTRDYPYSISCFRGTPTEIKLPAPPANPSFWTILWRSISKKITSFFNLFHG